MKKQAEVHSATLEACLPKMIAAGTQNVHLKLGHGPVFLSVLQTGKYIVQILKHFPPMAGLK